MRTNPVRNPARRWTTANVRRKAGTGRNALPRSHSEEVPDNGCHEEHRYDHHDDLDGIHQYDSRATRGGLNPRSLRLFVTTETLESDIAALARIGDSSHPVSG